MSPFEIIMLICFGAAWPTSIYKSWTMRSTNGKSLSFLVIVGLGYVAGVLHKVFFHFDGVVWLYALNLAMVLIDVGLWFRNRALEKKLS